MRRTVQHLEVKTGPLYVAMGCCRLSHPLFVIGSTKLAARQQVSQRPVTAQLREMAVANRAIATEQQKASTLMPTLSSIASAAPFVGLFGTVWGIMDAFIRIGVEKSASLPVVAPAIGEALIATAFGLIAAIPATIGFNYVDRRIGDLLEELHASSQTWAQMLAADPAGPSSAVPLVRESNRPPAMGAMGR